MAGKRHSCIWQGFTRHPDATGIQTHFYLHRAHTPVRKMSKSIAGQGVGILGDDEGTDWVWRNGVPTLMKQKRAWYHKQLGEGRGTCSRPEDLKKLKKLARHGSACLQSQPFGKRRQKDHEFSANLVSKTRLCPNLPPPQKNRKQQFQFGWKIQNEVKVLG